jgi:prepilin-type N-terminal cleavage/methylation domain-containing protein
MHTHNQHPLRERGFTLIEVLLVIALIAVLATIVVIALNPGRQLDQAKNATRRNHVETILNAITQYTLDHNGQFPTNIPFDLQGCADNYLICKTGVQCEQGGIDLSVLTEEGLYLPSIPLDPTITPEDEKSGYGVILNQHGRAVVCAPYADFNELIEVTR